MQSDQLDQLIPALVKAQAKITGAKKDKQNPHFKSNYADLESVWEACRGPLTENGLCVVQTTESGDAAVYLSTRLYHVSGQWLGGILPLSCDPRNPQSVGSAITYARRYALSALVGVCPEDDDGHAAAQPAPRREPERERERAPSQGRPDPTQGYAAPRHEANGNGDHGGGERRQYDGPPKSGRALFAWSKDQEQRYQIGLIKYLQEFGKLQEWHGKMVDWTPEVVALAYAEATRKLAAVGASDREPGSDG